jgi:DNA-binding CsgD family transcriptional regulator
MARALKTHASKGADFPATARLRAGLLIAPDLENLVSLFAGALAEHGIDGHFCLRKSGSGYTPLVGDCPELIAHDGDCIHVDTDDAFMPGTRVLLAAPPHGLSAEHKARIRGYAELFAARALALQELVDDVNTECGLSLRERFVLGRRLAGLAPVDIAIEGKISVATVSAAIDSAIQKMGVQTLAEAISLSARRGWLAVTSLQNCSSSSAKLTYKTTQNG